MKVAGICGSPRSGNTEFMLKVALDAAEKNGAEICLISLKRMDIGFTGEGLADDFGKILPEILDADALVFASPCYYDMITPQLLNIIDRLDPYAESMNGKKAGIIVSGKEDFEISGKNAVNYLKRACRIYDMKVIGAVFGKAEKAGEIAKNEEVLLKLRELGRKISK